jgi:putative glutamine amidotransferase
VPRPRIAVLGRFTESASALRYRGVVSSRALLEVVWTGGGDPVTLLPGDEPDALDWGARLEGFAAVLLPGGGDVDPARYGADREHEAVYDVDVIQDECDFTLARHCLDHGVPLLAVCRGLHVVNVVRGGSLVVDMPEHHRHTVQSVELLDGAESLGIGAPSVEISCYHHQAIDRLGAGMRVVARADDGTVEAVVIDAPAWSAGVQWHPEDTFRRDAAQVELLSRFVEAAASRT